MKKVLTYGTFDLFHEGHKNLLQRAKELGDYLVVAVSTDEFNESKGKHSVYSYSIRKNMVESLPYVDEVIPETCWEQKVDDIINNNIDVVVLGSDWAGSDKFDYLKEYCEVTFLPRTPGISTTEIKQELGIEIDGSKSFDSSDNSFSNQKKVGFELSSLASFEQVGNIIKIKKDN